MPQKNITDKKVIVAGHICLDIIPKLYKGAPAFTPGQLIESGPVTISTGGAVSNTGISLHRLGVNVRLAGKTGDDIFGGIIRDLLSQNSEGLADDMVISPGEASSYTIVINPPDTDRMFFHAPGCNSTFRSDDIPDDMLKSAQLFHFGYPPLMKSMSNDCGKESLALFQRAKAYGLTMSLDMAMPDDTGWAKDIDWVSYLTATLPYVDIFMPNIMEISRMLRTLPLSVALPRNEREALENPEALKEIAGFLIDAGAGVVALKAGEFGLYVRTAGRERLMQGGAVLQNTDSSWVNREVWAPCYSVDVSGATGSGDATIAGFILGALQGMSFADAVKAACAVGACSVERLDATSGVRPWEETLRRIQTGWERRIFTINDPRWRWNPDDEFWETA